MAKTKTKKKVGRPAGKKNKATQRWEFLRDVMLPAIAKAHDVSDPVEAIAAWMNNTPENMEWFMKAAMETCFTRRVTTDVSPEQLEIEKIRANAQQPGDNQGGQSINFYGNGLPLNPERQLVDKEEFIDVQAETVEPKQLEQKVEKDCLDEEDV